MSNGLFTSKSSWGEKKGDIEFPSVPRGLKGHRLKSHSLSLILNLKFALGFTLQSVSVLIP